MKSVVIAQSTTERQGLVSLALVASDILAPVSAQAVEANGIVTEVSHKESQVDANKVATAIEAIAEEVTTSGDKPAANVDGDDVVDVNADPIISEPSDEDRRDPFAMFEETLRRWNGVQHFEEKDIQLLVRLAAVRRAQMTISAELSKHEPFKPVKVDDIQGTEGYDQIQQLYSEGKFEEAAPLLEDLIQSTTDAMVKIALPEELKEDNEISNSTDKFEQFTKVVNCQIKQQMFGNASQRDAQNLNSMITMIHKEARERILEDIGLPFLIPRMDPETETLKHLMENRGLIEALSRKEGDAEGSGAIASSDFNLSSDVVAENDADVAAAPGADVAATPDEGAATA